MSPSSTKFHAGTQDSGCPPLVVPAFSRTTRLAWRCRPRTDEGLLDGLSFIWFHVVFFFFIIYMNIYDTCLWLHCGVCFLHLFSRKYICQKHTTSFNIALDVSGVPHPKKNNSMRLKGDEVSDSTELHVEHRGLPIAFWLALIQPHSRESQLQWAIWE